MDEYGQFQQHRAHRLIESAGRLYRIVSSLEKYPKMDSTRVNSLFDAKKQEFGISHTLKDEQLELITAVMNRRNCLGLLPTGFGKTMCFIAPAVICEKTTTLVISPLISLMEDQKNTLTAWGFKCARLDPNMEKEEETSKFFTYSMEGNFSCQGQPMF